MTGETYDVGKFTVEVPEGWTACPAYDYAADKDNCDYSVFLILDGNDRGDYGEKPSVYYYYDEEKSVKSYKAFSRKGSDEAEDIIVNIDGTDYEGLEVTSRMASKDVYWTYDRIFIPVTDESCLMIEVSVDSSEFQGVGMDDEKVQLMIAGTSMV